MGANKSKQKPNPEYQDKKLPELPCVYCGQNTCKDGKCSFPKCPSKTGCLKCSDRSSGLCENRGWCKKVPGICPVLVRERTRSHQAHKERKRGQDMFEELHQHPSGRSNIDELLPHSHCGCGEKLIQHTTFIKCAEDKCGWLPFCPGICPKVAERRRLKDSEQMALEQDLGKIIHHDENGHCICGTCDATKIIKVVTKIKSESIPVWKKYWQKYKQRKKLNLKDQGEADGRHWIWKQWDVHHGHKPHTITEYCENWRPKALVRHKTEKECRNDGCQWEGVCPTLKCDEEKCPNFGCSLRQYDRRCASRECPTVTCVECIPSSEEIHCQRPEFRECVWAAEAESCEVIPDNIDKVVTHCMGGNLWFPFHGEVNQFAYGRCWLQFAPGKKLRKCTPNGNKNVTTVTTPAMCPRGFFEDTFEVDALMFSTRSEHNAMINVRAQGPLYLGLNHRTARILAAWAHKNGIDDRTKVDHPEYQVSYSEFLRVRGYGSVLGTQHPAQPVLRSQHSIDVSLPGYYGGDNGDGELSPNDAGPAPEVTTKTSTQGHSQAGQQGVQFLQTRKVFPTILHRRVACDPQAPGASPTLPTGETVATPQDGVSICFWLAAVLVLACLVYLVYWFVARRFVRKGPEPRFSERDLEAAWPHEVRHLRVDRANL